MEFSFNRNPGAEHDTSKISNERLRKAIERNKSKQHKRTGQAARPTRASLRANSAQAPTANKMSLAEKFRAQRPPGMPAADLASKMKASEFGNNQGLGNNQDGGASLLQKMKARREGHTQAKAQPARSAAPAPSLRRKPLTTVENIEIQAPAVRRQSRTEVAYPRKGTGAKRTISAKRKVKSKSKNGSFLSAWFVKGTWIFCAFLLGRLVFSDGGILEYYDQSSVLDNKKFELEATKIENRDLMVELENIKTSPRFQRKLVRDHLGYIARDEYLILFSKNSKKFQRGEVSSI